MRARFAWRRVMQGSSPRGLPPEFVDKMYDDYDRETRRTVLALYRATPEDVRRRVLELRSLLTSDGLDAGPVVLGDVEVMQASAQR